MPRGTPNIPRVPCAHLGAPRSPTAPRAELTLTHFPARRAAAPCPPAPPPAPLSPPRDAAPRPSPAVSPHRPGQTHGLPADTERSGASRRPSEGRRAGLSPGAATTCGLSCRASSRRSLSTAGMLVLRRGGALAGAGCAALARPGGGARQCPSLPLSGPAGAAPALCRHRARLHGSAGGAGTGAAHSAQFPSAGGSESRGGPVGGGFLPPLARRAAGRRSQMEGGRALLPARLAGWSGLPQPRPRESRVAEGGMEQGPWMPPQLREAVRARGCDANRGKIAPFSLSLGGLRTSSCGRALCCALLRCTAGTLSEIITTACLSVTRVCGICICSCPWTTLQV